MGGELLGLSQLEAELLGCRMAAAALCPAVQQLYEFQKINVILVCPGGIWTRRVRTHHLGVLPCVSARFLGMFWGWSGGGQWGNVQRVALALGLQIDFPKMPGTLPCNSTACAKSAGS